VSAVGGTGKNTEEIGSSADADNADTPADAFDVDAINDALTEAAANAEEERWTL
jgi:hypothetical protein